MRTDDAGVVKSVPHGPRKRMQASDVEKALNGERPWRTALTLCAELQQASQCRESLVCITISQSAFGVSV